MPLPLDPQESPESPMTLIPTPEHHHHLLTVDPMVRQMVLLMDPPASHPTPSMLDLTNSSSQSPSLTMLSPLLASLAMPDRSTPWPMGRLSAQ